MMFGCHDRLLEKIKIGVMVVVLGLVVVVVVVGYCN